MTTQQPLADATPFRFHLLLLRALGRRCPRCGDGALYRGYLKPVVACAVCGEPLGHIRSDDGPAWLTILVVGHLVVPALVAVEMRGLWPEWLSMLVWPTLVATLTLLILPSAKALFIGILWRTRAPGSEME